MRPTLPRSFSNPLPKTHSPTPSSDRTCLDLALPVVIHCPLFREVQEDHKQKNNQVSQGLPIPFSTEAPKVTNQKNGTHTPAHRKWSVRLCLKDMTLKVHGTRQPLSTWVQASDTEPVGLPGTSTLWVREGGTSSQTRGGRAAPSRELQMGALEHGPPWEPSDGI